MSVGGKIKARKLDLLRIGVLLLGISAIIFAGIALHWYYKIQIEKPWKPGLPSFWVRCEEKTIIIGARYDLENVSVKNNLGNTLCRFKLIKKGSDEICFVNSSGVFIVESGEIKKAVVCEESLKIHKIPSID